MLKGQIKKMFLWEKNWEVVFHKIKFYITLANEYLDINKFSFVIGKEPWKITYSCQIP